MSEEVTERRLCLRCLSGGEDAMDGGRRVRRIKQGAQLYVGRGCYTCAKKIPAPDPLMQIECTCIVICGGVMVVERTESTLFRKEIELYSTLSVQYIGFMHCTCILIDGNSRYIYIYLWSIYIFEVFNYVEHRWERYQINIF